MSLYRMIPLYRRQSDKARRCVVRDTRAKGQVARTGRTANGKNKLSAPVNSAQGGSKTGNTLLAGLGDALDAQNTGNFLDIGEDGFKLPFVGDFEIGVNARVGAVRAAFEVMNVGTGAADDGGDFGEQAGAVARADGELDGKSGFRTAAPFDGDAAFGLVQKILDVGTHARVNGNAAAARNVADDFIARNRVATFGAVYEQIVVAFDDERGGAESEHALDGFDQRGLGVGSFGVPGFFRLAQE